MFAAYYDLSVAPPTYDIVAFLSHVEAERLRRSEDKTRIVFLPGPVDGFRRDSFWPFSADERRLILHRVAIPMAQMLPSAEVRVCPYRPEKPEPNSIGWRQPLYGLALHVKALKAGVRPLVEECGQWKGNPLVTITLREAEHWPQRNSNPEEWLKAYYAIQAMGFDVIVVRDTHKADQALPAGIRTSYRASWQLSHRAVLYRSAVLNCGVNNGPMWFAMALDAPVLMFKPTVENHRSSTKSYFRQCGIEPGGQYPNSPKHHRVVWEEDNAITIIRAFKEFIGENRSNASASQCYAEPVSTFQSEGLDQLQSGSC